MFELTPSGRTVLRVNIVKSCGDEDLELLCTDLGVDAENVPGKDNGKEYWVSQIIIYFERRQRTSALVAYLAQQRPAVAWQQLLDEAAQKAVAAQTEGGKMAVIDAGLSALSALISQVPDARDAVVTSRADLQNAYDRIQVLSGYKLLHDLFQQIEDHHNVLFQMSKRLPDDDSAWDDIARSEPELQDVAGQLIAAAQTQAAAPAAPAANLWVARLDRARTDLAGAAKNAELDQFKKALTRISEVIGMQLSRVNANLVAAAKDLRLARLVDALAVVRRKLAAINLDASPDRFEDRTMFEQCVESLKERNEYLNRLVQQHDAFQQIDDELRRIQAQISQDLSELENAWVDVRPMLQALCQGRSEQWAIDLGQTSADLDAALADKNPGKIRRTFLRCCTQTSLGFNQMDIDLLKQCSELQKVDGPLAGVIKLII